MSPRHRSFCARRSSRSQPTSRSSSFERVRRSSKERLEARLGAAGEATEQRRAELEALEEQLLAMRAAVAEREGALTRAGEKVTALEARGSRDGICV